MKNEPKDFPAPWRLSFDGDAIVDGNSERILNIDGEELDYWPKALAVMLAAPDMLAALEDESHVSTAWMLDWVADRMVKVYGESENVDFVLSIRKRAKLCRAALQKAKGTP